MEREANVFTVYATYTDPGEGMMVTQAFTQPTAIIPIGKIAKGSYEGRLKVTKMILDSKGENIIEKEKELNVHEFKIE